MSQVSLRGWCPSRAVENSCDLRGLHRNGRRPRRFWSRGWLLLSSIVIFPSKTHMSCLRPASNCQQIRATEAAADRLGAMNSSPKHGLLDSNLKLKVRRLREMLQLDKALEEVSTYFHTVLVPDDDFVMAGTQTHDA